MSKKTTARRKEDKTQEVLNGSGAFLFSDSCNYNGEWLIVEGVKKKHGKGIYTDGNNVFEGEFVQDEMQGSGKMTFASGAVYEGQFVKNKFEGKGKYTWPDSSWYEGDWLNNRMHGTGVYCSKDGKRWTGNYYNGTAEGLDRELIDPDL